MVTDILFDCAVLGVFMLLYVKKKLFVIHERNDKLALLPKEKAIQDADTPLRNSDGKSRNFHFADPSPRALLDF